ncbi:3'-5' exonuclease [Puniceicoccus vermicola]|uniref:3'-5' exonuclease n=1 Tax=Puniceicoccus vermicola TaxID=388746 RepID=UPI00163A5BF8|nr:3'-5' exonuclease [Puniceicoccus vermicola]
MVELARFWNEAHAAGFESVYAMDFEGGDRTGVVEYGVVEITAEGIRQTWTGLCGPASVVPAWESDTHGLYQEDLTGKPPFSDFWELFRDLRRSGPFLAHSAQVEDRFLRRQWRTPGEVTDWSFAGRSVIEWGPWLDSCGLFRTLRPGGSASLGDLVAAEGLVEPLDGLAVDRCPEKRACWHAALYDSMASALLFERVVAEKPDWSLGRMFRESQGRGEAPAEQIDLF